MFLPNHLFHLNSSKAYTLESLNKQWTEIALVRYEKYKNKFSAYPTLFTDPNAFVGFPTSYNTKNQPLQIGQFGFSYSDGNLRSYILLHETFFKHLVATSKNSMKERYSKYQLWYTIKVGDQFYYCTVN